MKMCIRDRVYTGIYEFDGNELRVLEDQMAVSIEELGEKLKQYSSCLLYTSRCV